MLYRLHKVSLALILLAFSSLGGFGRYPTKLGRIYRGADRLTLSSKPPEE